jgi:hypothetical protein
MELTFLAKPIVLIIEIVRMVADPALDEKFSSTDVLGESDFG